MLFLALVFLRLLRFLPASVVSFCHTKCISLLMALSYHAVFLHAPDAGALILPRAHVFIAARTDDDDADERLIYPLPSLDRFRG